MVQFRSLSGRQKIPLEFLLLCASDWGKCHNSAWRIKERDEWFDLDLVFQHHPPPGLPKRREVLWISCCCSWGWPSRPGTASRHAVSSPLSIGGHLQRPALGCSDLRVPSSSPSSQSSPLPLFALPCLYAARVPICWSAGFVKRVALAAKRFSLRLYPPTKGLVHRRPLSALRAHFCFVRHGISPINRYGASALILLRRSRNIMAAIAGPPGEASSSNVTRNSSV